MANALGDIKNQRYKLGNSLIKINKSMAKNNSLIISTLITLEIIASGLVGYYFFADTFAKKIESLSVKYYQ